MNSNASEDGVQVLEEVANATGLDILIEKTGGTTDLGADGTPEIILILQYAGLTVTSGFFAAIGADVWKMVKDFTRETFQKYKKEFNSEGQWIYNPIIVIEFSTNESILLQVQFPNKSEEFEASLESLHEALRGFNLQKYNLMKFEDNTWTYSTEKFKNQEQVHGEFFKQ